jgi:hypothetical protein
LNHKSRGACYVGNNSNLFLSSILSKENLSSGENLAKLKKIIPGWAFKVNSLVSSMFYFKVYSLFPLESKVNLKCISDTN